MKTFIKFLLRRKLNKLNVKLMSAKVDKLVIEDQYNYWTGLTRLDGSISYMLAGKRNTAMEKFIRIVAKITMIESEIQKVTTKISVFR